MNKDILDLKIRKYFKENHGLELSDVDLEETSQSLIHLGRAIVRFYAQERGDGQQKST